ncbi:hypothetical protein BJ138DRAFT_1131304 [Hygrophoropsis aurantiaca]|uniref:Uncharacterized protein n=1 Tax=Hygrophoropsis aurantiaca TaxID=72124 RepID=A0ACB7ZS62_9AGAM|nr:hypothetical protein BJ138DRAFT_1131304 [Hygrophoropsis aurantiaca]
MENSSNTNRRSARLQKGPGPENEDQAVQSDLPANNEASLPARPSTTDPLPEGAIPSFPDSSTAQKRARAASTVENASKKAYIPKNPTKKLKGADLTEEPQENKGKSVSKARSHKTAQVPRSPLPARTTRVVDPAGPDKPRTKRTPAEVQAARQQKEELIKKLREFERLTLEKLAPKIFEASLVFCQYWLTLLVELEDESAEDEEDRNAVMSLRDVERLEHDQFGDKAEGETSDEALESFNDDVNMGEVVDDMDSIQKLLSQRGGKQDEKKAALKKPKKLGKGETRAAVEAQKESLRKGKQKEKSIKIDGGRETKQHVSHKEKTKATLPSGLLPNWRKRNGVVVADDKAQPLPPSVGGLDDYDASANRPKLSINTRDDARINAMVQVLSESDSEDEAIVFKANTKPTRKANTKATPAKTPTTQRSSGRNAATAQTQKSEVKPVILTSDSPDVSSLPAFRARMLRGTYLPRTIQMFQSCKRLWM